ncbi:grancalcin-like [Choristoneura fumiferana]|uniref:grancalcin-like n=1 Tax=Choristoneura fumiferana TaxID=7141 RepID=UPI003D159274
MAYNPNYGQQPGYGQPPPGQLEVGHGPYPSMGAGVASRLKYNNGSAQSTKTIRFITADELKSALVNAQGKTFSHTACSLMIGMFDKDRSGHINVEEFDKLYTYVNQWLTVFKTYDLDQSGQIDESELTKVVHLLKKENQTGVTTKNKYSIISQSGTSNIPAPPPTPPSPL